MILNSPYISGSLTVTGNITSQGGITISGSITSASYATTSSFATTASYANTSTSASYALTASFATNFTASNILASNTITAQTLVVQTVTSSIVYSSGSNIFGNQLTNVQQMTGSLRVTGSITSTGAATFNGAVTIGNDNAYALTIGRYSAAIPISYIKASTSSTGGFRLTNHNGADVIVVSGSNYITLDAPTTTTGAATFSSSVSALSLDVISSSGVGTSTAAGLARFITAATTDAISIGQSNNTRTINLSSYYIFGQGNDNYCGTTSAHDYIFYTNSTEKMIIKSGGNVGIGTSSPSDKLQVSGSIRWGSATNNIVSSNDGSGVYMELAGTSTATRRLRIQGINDAGNKYSAIKLQAGAEVISFETADVERMRITSVGYTKISNNGTYINSSLYYHEIRQSGDDWILAATCTSATDPRGIYLGYPSMSPNSSTAYFLYCEDSTATRFYISSDGYVHSRSTSIVIISSDENLKKDITDYDKGLSEVLAMKPRYYRYKAEPEKLQIGFIAQEMDEALKGSMVDSNEKNEETGENYKTYQVEWYPLLVKAIQEQNQMITSLQERLTKAGL